MSVRVPKGQKVLTMLTIAWRAGNNRTVVRSIPMNVSVRPGSTMDFSISACFSDKMRVIE